MKKTKDKKINMILLLISIVLLLLAIFITKSSAVRPFFWILSIILLTANIAISNNFKSVKTITLLLILLIISIIGDGIIVYSLKRIPVFSFNIISTEKTIVYNSIGMRVWQCDKNDYKNLIIDPFYESGYMCDAEDITVMDSNSFLNSIVSNHSEYRNKYVKINGKISKKTGQNYIEMRPYSSSDITVNGYVEFADNITLRIIFNNGEPALDNYDIYDEITIVGIVKNMENESGKYVIYMYDSKVVSAINLNEYTVTITSSRKCNTEPKLIHSNDTANIYTYCIDEAIVSYPDNKYELPQALSSNKIKIEDLYNGTNNIDINEDDNSKIYRFEEYSILVCNPEKSKDIIIGKKKMSFKDVECQLKVEE